METGLSSNATPLVPGFRTLLSAAAPVLLLVFAAPVASQDGSTATEAAAPTPAAEAPAAPPPRINLMVTVPRSQVNQAQTKECVDRADAGTISGEIVVCREVEVDNSALTGDRTASQKRYAQETAFKGAPPPPDMFGISDNGKGIGFGGVPPPAVFIDVEALPKAPAGSDADRIARGLPPRGSRHQDGRASAQGEEKGLAVSYVPPNGGAGRPPHLTTRSLYHTIVLLDRGRAG
jgi:hypothetical protein